MKRQSDKDDGSSSRHSTRLECDEELPLGDSTLLAKAVEFLAEGVVITDDELDWPGPRILFVNNAMCQITGYMANELIGKTPRILQQNYSNRTMLDQLKRDLKNGRSFLCEVINYRKDGTPYDAELFITALYDQTGRRTNFVSIHRDISDRKKAAKALEEGEHRLRSILDTAADAIITIDCRGIILTANTASQRMFGYSEKELIGQNVNILMPVPYRDSHDGYLERYLKTREPRIIGIGREAIGLRKDASMFPVSLAVSEVERGQVFTGIIRDLSSLKELQNRILEIASEEQRRIGQELHDGVAQELTGISLFVRTMMNRIDNIRQNISSVEHSPARMPTDLEGLYDIAQTVGQRLNETHRHVQELSRGMMPVQVDANGLQAALEELTSALNKTGIIDCHFDCLKSIELSDNTTATHLYRIAQEAVNNSIRHAQASRIDIRLEKIRSGLQMEIRDNGIGFKPEKKKSGIRKGAGQHLMEYRASLIGGQIQIENLPEGGTLVRCVCLF